MEKYWYDANGQRIIKQNSVGEFTYYVNQYYEIDNGTATSYFFRDDERIAKQTSEGMEWYLSDHLGSTTLLVNESGLEVERTEYYPFGEVLSGGLEKYGFTGQENDADTELMYYGARYYSPEYRIFVQPDTMLPDVYNPQALNRYAYCLNNPLKYTDPSGHCITPETAVDLLFLSVSVGLFVDDPSLVGAGFVAWDVIATAVPLLPGSYIARGPQGLRYLYKYLKYTDSLDIYEKIVYKSRSFTSETALNLATSIAVYGKDGYEYNKNYEYLVENFGENTPENFNFEGTNKAYYFTQDEQRINTLWKDGYVLYGFNKEKTKALWINPDGDLNIENIDSENEEDDEDE